MYIQKSIKFSRLNLEGFVPDKITSYFQSVVTNKQYYIRLPAP